MNDEWPIKGTQSHRGVNAECRMMNAESPIRGVRPEGNMDVSAKRPYHTELESRD